MAQIIQQVSLEDVRFYSPIGFYEEEQILGNEFFVTVSVSFPFKNPDSEVLENTINYEEIYRILVEVMSPRRKLLESAAEDILNKLVETYSSVQKIDVRIRKSNPPFGGDLANSVVSLHYSKD
ncbi:MULTISPECIES: dihydroneopterin aldolase [Sphingobacterium]|uniref:7,8-dihydroneopterin aldolase n=1 Tax=Sphingobacterium tenebrionis TaxID=3111775 RepID=A0ABU8I3R1_9SPHI|nr:dihydroneopterin aldolase [Sphingobacterium sp. CZ-2]QBR11933.1 dihydroneopterin aldolase [Sphingobacterium sp. CZ-2]